VSWRRRAAIAAIAVGLGAIGSAALLPVDAGAAGGFTAFASAEGVRAIVTADGFPIASTPFDGGLPVAQVGLDSLGGGTGFASIAYPGDLVVSLPGLVAGLTNGGLPPVPSYPIIAKADGLHPDATVDSPGSTMEAHSTDRSAASAATAGVQSGDIGLAPLRASADAKVDDDGTVRVSSVSSATGFSVGPLRIGDVRATASVTLGPDGKLVRDADFTVSVLDVAGVKLGFGDQGLVLAGTKIPLDLNGPVGSLLTGSGVSLKTLKREDTPSGVVAGGLEITFDEATGLAVSRVQVTLALGRASASITGGAAAAAAPPVDAVAPEDVSGPSTQAPVGAEIPAFTDPGPQIPAPPSIAPTAPTAPIIKSTNVSFATWDLSRVYLALVGAALLAGGAIQLISQLGVRSRWT
jgi:hypothetical protein